ncbi:MAG: HAMP domain-containing histidine kinase [Firmicutes bacterium]|nr:HAMP domain-containing histidine kinase [Bacillota bacterium]
MDTKWKSIRKVLSFIIFFLGVSLTLGNLAGVIRRMPDKTGEWASGSLLEEDYQRTDDFRQHISNRLENFLSIAVNGCPVGYRYYDAYDTYYTYSYEGSAAYAGEMSAVEDLGLTQGTDILIPQEWWEEEEPEDPLTEEEREKSIEEQKARIARQNKRLTEEYLEGMKEDKSLLYSIYYDGELLYSNTDALAADDSMQAPEGYNFLLYFDGEKARIMKDGKEEDIYGDGYFRWEEGDWYVPGYRNFPANEEMKKAVVCIAAAKEPLPYTTGISRNSDYRRQGDGYRQQGNELYYIQYRLTENRKLLLQSLVGLIAGLALLILSCFCRKSRLEVKGKLAVLQGKIWVECKILLIAGVILRFLQEYVGNGSGGTWVWREISHAYAEGGLTAVSEYGYTDFLLSDLRYVSGGAWVLLFWAVYLTVNDLKHNKKVWRQGLIAKCCRTFSAREMKQPLARQMTRRNGILMGISAGFGILMLLLAAGIVWAFDTRADVTLIFILYLLGIVLLMLAVYLLGRKNVKAAKEVDALAKRIGEICSGDYSAKGSADQSGADPGADVGESGVTGRKDSGSAAAALAGGGLETARAQLENIRQGMADAVDEQMKSERMKVELIANVSHDLKTPLTSIISYVQFLKEEEGLPDHVKDYVKILDEKSQRLKNMVQDVFAVSKAASGELPMCMEPLDFGKLLRQTLADMDEEIENSSVSFRTELPEEPVMIVADGQRMYRVFQNLFQNALKYSLDGSRVYVALKVEGTVAVASVKNTSHMELDEDKNFTERFFRGDKSRTDGGSGLGLSIAQSFTEACGGQFELEFDADLFIVRVTFQMC